MTFCIDSGKNNGYPYIEDLSELPDSELKKPYYQYCLVAGGYRNNGYPVFHELNEIPESDMKKAYPHGYMICIKDKNNGYPCITELNSISVEKFSLLYFCGKRITEMYYNGNFISHAYMNEKEVFSIKYIIN